LQRAAIAGYRRSLLRGRGRGCDRGGERHCSEVQRVVAVSSSGAGLKTRGHVQAQLPRPAPPPRGGAGGSVPPSARIFMFCSAVVKVAVRRARSAALAASSASIELS